MKKCVIIDNKMRTIEKDTIKSLGYELIELSNNTNLYDEISSHVDIFCTKIKDKVVLEKNTYDNLRSKINSSNFLKGQAKLSEKYPLDISYNVCNIGDFAIHNFKYTDKVVLDVIEELNVKKIDISQGYSNCSIAVIDESSAIVTDKNIYDTLTKYNLEVLYLDYIPDIKLLKNSKYSKMTGFIGGAMSRIGNNIIVFGDLSKIDKFGKIREFILSKKLNLIDFKDLDVIDYGGILEV